MNQKHCQFDVDKHINIERISTVVKFYISVRILDSMRLRIIRSLPILVLVALFATITIHAGAQGIGVSLNGDPVGFPGLGPQQIQGRVLVPVRGVLEKLGANVAWMPQTRIVVASNANVDIELKIGDVNAVVNGKTVVLDVPAQIIQGSTFVPLRFLGEALGAKVGWNGATRTVSILTGPQANAQDQHRDRDKTDRDNKDRDDHDKDRDKKVHDRPEDHAVRPPVRNGPMPVITSFTDDVKGWLRGGETVRVSLEGTPGGQATFRIPGLAEEVPMREVSAGHYVGAWQIPNEKPIQLPNAAVIGSLKVGNQASQLIQAPGAVSVDSIPPTIKDRAPSADAHVFSARPTIYAVFDDAGSGVEPNSIKLLVNGRDVTPNATVNANFITYTPSEPLEPGPQHIQVYEADRAGNRTQASWAFIEESKAAEGIRSVSENANHPLQAGETVHIEANGTPGGHATFSMGNIHNIPMAEVSPGRYEVDYTVRRGDEVEGRLLTIQLQTRDGLILQRQSEHPIIVNTSSPTTPVITYPNPKDAPTGSFSIRGTANPNSRVHVRLNYESRIAGIVGVKGTVVDEVVEADPNGHWQTPPISVNSLLGAGKVDYIVTATSVTARGKESDTTSVRFKNR